MYWFRHILMIRATAAAVLAALAVVIAIFGADDSAVARVQDEDAGQCWDPDIEFPVPCDEDEE